MAVFIPGSRPEDFNGSYGEMAVYDALKKLSDDYTVFYSLSWVGVNDRRSIGEADFVVAHPDKGILVIEVKAGEIEYKDGEWYQINTKSRKSKRIDPFVQSRKSMFELMDRIGSGIKDFRLPMFCYGVWFTSVEVSERNMLPPESPNEIILDVLDLDHAPRSIDAVYDYWAGKYQMVSLDDLQYKRLIEQLCPHFHVIPKIKMEDGENEAKKDGYIQLTGQQRALLNFLQEERSAVIGGLSGTGKSVLAAETAKRLAEQEKKVLFLCSSVRLKNALDKHAAVPGVKYHSLSSLEEELKAKDGSGEGLIQLISSAASGWKYTDLIIDEAHNMDNEMLDLLYDLIEEKQGSFYVFYNCKADIRRNSESLPKWAEEAEMKLLLKHSFARNK